MTRFRERSIPSWLPVNLDTSVSNPTYNRSSNDAYNMYESMTDTVTPGFFSSKKSGKLLSINSMTKTKKTYESPYGSVRWERRRKSDGFTTWSEWYGHLCMPVIWRTTAFSTSPGGSPWVVWPTSVSKPAWPDESEVITKALADARTKGMDLLTFSAELHKTVGMIKNFRNNVLKRAERVQRQVLRKHDAGVWTSAELLNAFSQTWLEARYGWRILAYEADDINRQLLKIRSLASKVVRGYATEETTLERIVHNASLISLSKYRYGYTVQLGTDFSQANGLITQTCTRRLRSGSLINAIAEGLAFGDPINTLWEVTPFSFIVDWFTNIGENLQAYAPTANGQLLGSWVSAEEVIETTVMMTPVSHETSTYTWTPSTTNPMILTARQESYDRYPVTPSFNLSLRLHLDTAKITDLLSIFWLRYMKLTRELIRNSRV